MVGHGKMNADVGEMAVLLRQWPVPPTPGRHYYLSMDVCDMIIAGRLVDARNLCKRGYTGSMVFSPIPGDESAVDDPDSWNSDVDDEDEEVGASWIDSLADDGDWSCDEMNAANDATTTG